MDNINFQICNTEFEPSLRSEPILMVTNLSENMFETIIKNIKRENLPPVPDEDYDFEDAIEEKLFLQDNISTPSSLNVSKSSIQVIIDVNIILAINYEFKFLTFNCESQEVLHGFNLLVLGSMSVFYKLKSCSNHCNKRDYLSSTNHH